MECFCGNLQLPLYLLIPACHASSVPAFVFLLRGINIFLSDSLWSPSCSESALWLALGPSFSQIKKQAMEETHTSALAWVWAGFLKMLASCTPPACQGWQEVLVAVPNLAQLALALQEISSMFYNAKTYQKLFLFCFLSHCFIHLFGWFCPSG